MQVVPCNTEESHKLLRDHIMANEKISLKFNNFQEVRHWKESSEDFLENDK